MRRIKALFGPQGLLKQGVILNDDPKSHFKNLKALPAADSLGLSEQAGLAYRSILYLVERRASGRTDQPAAAAPSSTGGTAAGSADRASATSSAMSRERVAPADGSAPNPSPIITAQ